jgi:hypothetical protein
MSYNSKFFLGLYNLSSSEVSVWRPSYGGGELTQDKPYKRYLLDLRSRRCSLGQAMAEIEDEDDYD